MFETHFIVDRYFPLFTTTYYNESPLEGHMIVKDVLIIPFAIAMSGKSTTFANEVRSASNIDT